MSTACTEEHMALLRSIRDAFFDECNMQNTIEKLLAFRDFAEVHGITDLVIMCIRQNINPMYTELGVALLQDCPLQILQYNDLNSTQLEILQKHVQYLSDNQLCSSSTEMGGGHRLSALRHGLPKVYLNPGIVLFACRQIITDNLHSNLSERTVSNVLLQRILCSVNVRPECINHAEDLLIQSQKTLGIKRKLE